MRLKTLFIILPLVLASSCRTIAPMPDVHIGTAVWTDRIDTSYGKFFSYSDPRNVAKQYKLMAAEVFQKKTILMSSDDYFALRKWGAKAEIQIGELERKLQECK